MKSIKSFINKNTNIQVEELGRICLLLWKDSQSMEAIEAIASRFLLLLGDLMLLS